MTTFVLPERALDSNVDAAAGALCYIYEANSTTPATAYSDEAMTTAHEWPIVYDSAGAPPPCYVAPGVYKIDLQDADGVSLPGYPKDDLDYWGASSESEVRDNLGLGSIATQEADSVTITGNVTITGGAIDGVPIGGTTPGAGTFSQATIDADFPVLRLSEADNDDKKAGFSLIGGDLRFAFQNASGVGGAAFLRATRDGTDEQQAASVTINIVDAGTTDGQVLKCDEDGLVALRTAGFTSASGANVYIDSSNGRLFRSTSTGVYKINRLPISAPGEIIDGLEPVTFESTHEGDHSARFAGFIAEDVAEVLPEASVDGGENYDVRGIVAALVAEVQELRQRVAALEAG